MAKKNKLNEGRTKIVLESDDQTQVLLQFKDDVPAKKGVKKGSVKGKSAVNNKISAFLLKYLEGYNVNTHFIKEESETEMLVQKCDMIRTEIVMRNVAAGDMCRKYGFEEGLDLPMPILEYYLKDDDHQNPLINEYHIYAMKLATQQELQVIAKFALKINAVLKSFFQRRGVVLVDFRLEFGKIEDKIILADEISPDTCCLWDSKTKDRLDITRYYDGLGKVEETYQDILKRVLS